MSQAHLSSPAHAPRPSRLVLPTLLVVFAWGSVARAASPGSPKPGAPRMFGVVSDDAGLLGTGPSLAALRDRVQSATARAALPIEVAIVGGTASSQGAEGASLEEVARRRFDERPPSEGASDAVLLLVAPRAAQAVLETGKGEAGIVPEIDARRITADLRRLLARHASAASLTLALADAADRVADSALATRERRRPLAVAGAIDPDEELAPSPARPRPTTSPGGDGDRPPRRSLMPGAYALAIFMMLGLALRQRRRSRSDARSDARRR